MWRMDNTVTDHAAGKWFARFRSDDYHNEDMALPGLIFNYVDTEILTVVGPHPHMSIRHIAENTGASKLAGKNI